MCVRKKEGKRKGGKERARMEGREREKDSDHKLTSIPFLVQVVKGSMHDCKCIYLCQFYIPTISYVFTMLVDQSHNLCI